MFVKNLLRIFLKQFRLGSGFKWDLYRKCLILKMAGTTGLEPAASAVTGQRSNQLNYVPAA